ncbi:hypothetical protein [Candidatus Chlorohelix sp.]|uniref:hypothetical protein n=1 Tax=Candidatus Chlorohelix sp. TaxID=3139201 RepID=UPI00305FA89D
MVERIALAIGYEVAATIFLLGICKRVGQAKFQEKSYDWLYFLRIAMACVLAAQIGFVIWVSALFWNQHSMAVGLTALIGIPMVLFLTMLMMRSFADSYRAIPNLIHRLEQMNPEEREQTLEALPPETFLQLPGDYRFVSKKSDR